MNSDASATSTASADEADLARFGYSQELRRTLGGFSSFAVAFSYISPSTGIFALFFLGLTTLGGVFIWSWPIVALGQFLIALTFAELASHYPVAGSVFQWTKYVSGKTYSWFAGWLYLFAGVLTIASVCATLPFALIPAFDNMGWHLANSLHNQRIIAICTLVLVTVLNVFGVRLVAIVNNTGVLFEILAMVVFAFVLALFHHHQSVGVIFHTGGTTFTASTFLVAMFMSLFVIYGFDTAGTLAEETKNPRREAPRAVLLSIAGAFVIGGIFLYALLLAIPDMSTAIKEGWGPAQIIDANFGNAFSTVFLLTVAAAIFVCCLAIMTNVIRLTFSMARDDRLPASRQLAQVNPRLHTPVITCIVVGLLAFIPMLQYAGRDHRDRGDGDDLPQLLHLRRGGVARAADGRVAAHEGAVRAREVGVPVSVLGVGYGLAMLVNFAWPRVATNPTPNETGTLLDFHWKWLNDQPVLWTVAITITLVGAVYFALVQRTKPSHMQAPEGEAVLESPAVTA